MADKQIQHLLRRAGFGSTSDELAYYSQFSYSGAVDALLNYEQSADDVDSKVGTPGYVGVTTNGPFEPNSNIDHARQRWVFRMVHSQRPLQEKMTLFWHNHFATGYSKVRGVSPDAARLMAAKASEDAGGQQGQIELLRSYALGNFRDLLTNSRPGDDHLARRIHGHEDKPQRISRASCSPWASATHRGRCAGGGVYGLERRRGDVRAGRQMVVRVPREPAHVGQDVQLSHYADGSKTIRRVRRPTACGTHRPHQRLGRSSNTAIWPEADPHVRDRAVGSRPAFVNTLANVHLSSSYNMKSVMRALFLSRGLHPPLRALRVAGRVRRAGDQRGRMGGLLVSGATGALANMGQILYEPPDVAGWDLGQNWFSSGTMLARMNLGSTLTSNQKFNLRDAAKPFGKTADSLLSWMLDRMPMADYDSNTYNDLRSFLTSSTWTGSDAQLLTKASGLAHVILAAPQYQFM